MRSSHVCQLWSLNLGLTSPPPCTFITMMIRCEDDNGSACPLPHRCSSHTAFAKAHFLSAKTLLFMSLSTFLYLFDACGRSCSSLMSIQQLTSTVTHSSMAPGKAGICSSTKYHVTYASCRRGSCVQLSLIVFSNCCWFCGELDHR